MSGELDPRDRLAVAIAVYASTWPRPVNLADALLPVVDRIANQRAAAELRAAAGESKGLLMYRAASTVLRARADALDPR